MMWDGIWYLCMLFVAACTTNNWHPASAEAFNPFETIVQAIGNLLPKPETPDFVPCETREQCMASDASAVCSDTMHVCVGCRNAGVMCALYFGSQCSRGLQCVGNPVQRCVYWNCECAGGVMKMGNKYCAQFLYLNGSSAGSENFTSETASVSASTTESILLKSSISAEVGTSPAAMGSTNKPELNPFTINSTVIKSSSSVGMKNSTGESPGFSATSALTAAETSKESKFFKPSTFPSTEALGIETNTGVVFTTNPALKGITQSTITATGTETSSSAQGMRDLTTEEFLLNSVTAIKSTKGTVAEASSEENLATSGPTQSSTSDARNASSDFKTEVGLQGSSSQPASLMPLTQEGKSSTKSYFEREMASSELNKSLTSVDATISTSFKNEASLEQSTSQSSSSTSSSQEGKSSIESTTGSYFEGKMVSSELNKSLTSVDATISTSFKSEVSLEQSTSQPHSSTSSSQEAKSSTESTAGSYFEGKMVSSELNKSSTSDATISNSFKIEVTIESSTSQPHSSIPSTQEAKSSIESTTGSYFEGTVASIDLNKSLTSDATISPPLVTKFAFQRSTSWSPSISPVQEGKSSNGSTAESFERNSSSLNGQKQSPTSDPTNITSSVKIESVLQGSTSHYQYSSPSPHEGIGSLLKTSSSIMEKTSEYSAFNSSLFTTMSSGETGKISTKSQADQNSSPSFSTEINSVSFSMIPGTMTTTSSILLDTSRNSQATRNQTKAFGQFDFTSEKNIPVSESSQPDSVFKVTQSSNYPQVLPTTEPIDLNAVTSELVLPGKDLGHDEDTSRIPVSPVDNPLSSTTVAIPKSLLEVSGREASTIRSRNTFGPRTGQRTVPQPGSPAEDHSRSNKAFVDNIPSIQHSSTTTTTQSSLILPLIPTSRDEAISQRKVSPEALELIRQRAVLSRVLSSLSTIGLFLVILGLIYKTHAFKKKMKTHNSREESDDEDTLYEVELGMHPASDFYRVPGRRKNDVYQEVGLATCRGSQEFTEISNELPIQANVPHKVQVVSISGRCIALEPVKNNQNSLLDSSLGSGQFLMRPLVPIHQQLINKNKQNTHIKITVSPNSKDIEEGDNLPSSSSASHSAHPISSAPVSTARSNPAHRKLLTDLPDLQGSYEKLRPGYKTHKRPIAKHLNPLKIRRYRSLSAEEKNQCNLSSNNDKQQRPEYESTLYSPLFPPLWRQLLAPEEDSLPLVADIIRTHESAVKAAKLGAEKNVLFGIGF